MKRLLSALLMVLLLIEALPLNALAAAGHVLTEKELAAAYALTGLGEGGAQGNAAYHQGMMPNDTWNAIQLSDWLDDMLNVKVHSVQSILSQASYKLMQLQEKDPKAYARFANSEEFRDVANYAKNMFLEGEQTRQELRYQKDRIDEQANTIATMKARLEETDNAMFDSDRVRLSAKIEAAVAELKAARGEVSEKAAEWQSLFDLKQETLSTGFAGRGDEGPFGKVGDWLAELSDYGNGVQENTANIVAVDASNTRLGRMSATGSVLKNDSSATTRVIDQTQICLLFSTGSGSEKMAIPGVEVRIKDLRAVEGEGDGIIKKTADEDGRVTLEVNDFVVDDHKNICISLDVDCEALGYRSFGIEKLELKQGSIRPESLVPLDDQPYIYSASFNGHDILRDEWEMLYSNLNDWDFDIKVVTRKPGGGSTPAPLFSYWEKGGFMRDWKQSWSSASSQDGNTYVFRKKWKKIIAPELDSDQRPFFAFSKDKGSEHIPAGITSLQSVVDSPVDEGSDVFDEVLTDALSFTFVIPVIDAEVSLDLPFKQYLPKVTIDLSGYVTASIGSDLFTEKLENAKKINWQSKDLRDLKIDQDYYEKDGWLANYKAQLGVAYDYYRQKGSKFLYESKLEFGIFALLSGRWEIDNSEEDLTTKIVKIRGSVGFLAKYNFSWTWAFTLGPMPAYISFTLGVSAGLAIGLVLGFSWVNGHFRDWELKPFNDITISILFSFTAQAGAGIKGFAEIWVKFTASLNLRIRLVIFGREPNSLTISYGVNWAVGATLFWVSFKKTWNIAEGILYPRKRNTLTGVNPLEQYSEAAANATEEIIPAVQEPFAYPELVPEADIVLESQMNTKSNTRVVVCGGMTYVLYLKQVEGSDGKMHKRVSWYSLKDHSTGSIQGLIEAEQAAALNERDDYSFDAYVADGFIFVAATCAKDFDRNGNPVRNKLSSNDWNQKTYVAMLTPKDKRGSLTWKLPKGTYYYARTETETMLTYADNYMSQEQGCYDSVANPEITWAQARKENGKVTGIQVYGTLGRVTYDADEVPTGATSFRLVSGENGMLFFSDYFVHSSMNDDDYERTYIRGALTNSNPKTFPGTDLGRGFSFLALSRPKNGRKGDSVIELYDWELNNVGNWRDDRRAIPLVKGEIDRFELVQVPANEDGTRYGRMVFYTAKETDADGAKRDKLYGLYIEPTDNTSGTSRYADMSFNVSRYTYDITVPNGYFKVGYIGDTPYLYWLATAPKQKEDDPNVWRVYTVTYDISTNTMTDPAVYAEFKLPRMYCKADGRSFMLDTLPYSVTLTGDKAAYLTSVGDTEKIDESIRPDVPPLSLYSFPTLMKPTMDLNGLILQNTVSAGDFEDATIVVMNDGNMGISSFDVQLNVSEDGKLTPVERIHFDCLHPDNNRLELNTGGKYVLLDEGRQVGYRNSDFDYTARQRDWVLSEEKNAYHVSTQGGRVELVSAEPVDSKTEYVKTDMLMPGALASFTGTLKIPETWHGNMTLVMTVARVSTYSNWANAMMNAAGRSSRLSPVSNAAPQVEEIVYELNPKSGKLELQKRTANGQVSNAAASGLYADSIDAPDSITVNLGVQDIDVSHRLYRDSSGERMLDIILSNYANTLDSFKLSCAVYLDGAEDPVYVNLPYRDNAVSNRTTHTITLPVSALVDDPNAHSKARVQITAVGREEAVLANNEFMLLLGGSALGFARQPEDATVQEGEDVTFSVEPTGGRQPYTYQWQVWDPKHEKWVDLPGYTDPTLSRKDVEKKWDGARFRCVVTDAEGKQVVSREVTLTVRDRVPTGDGSNLPLYLAMAIAALILLLVLRRRQSGRAS